MDTNNLTNATTLFDNSTEPLGNSTSPPFDYTMLQPSAWALNITIVYLCLMAIIGVPGNALVLLVQFRIKEKSSTDLCVLLMAFFDMLCASVNIPIYIVRNIPSLWLVVQNDDICRFHYFLTYLVNVVSVMLLTGLAVERQSVTCRPVQSGVLRVRRVKFMCITSVIVSVSFSGLFASKIRLQNHSCQWRSDNLPLKSLLMFILMFMFIVCFVVIAVCYTKISMFLRRRHRGKVRQRVNLGPSKSYTINKVEPENTTTTCLNDRSTVPETSWHRLSPLPHELQKQNNGVMPLVNEPKEVINANGHASQHTVNSLHASPTTKKIFEPFKPTIDAVSPETTRDMTNKYLGTVNGALETEAAQTRAAPDLRALSISDYSNQSRPLDPLPSFSMQQRMDVERHNINRVTLMMFLITALYVVTWLLNWSTFLIMIKPSKAAINAAHLVKMAFLINTMANPFFYIGMSSRFRKMMPKLFKKV